MQAPFRAGSRVAGLAAAAALLWAVLPASAGARPHWAVPMPELLVDAGSTLGVTGKPGSGGATATAGVLWPVQGRFSFGLGLFADDLGTGDSDLHDPNTGEPLGTVATTHRWSFGGEWRAEAQLSDTRRLRVLWSAGFGYGRQERDQRGEVRDAASGVVASTAATFLAPIGRVHALGLALALRREFVHHESDPDRSTSWASAALEWRFRALPQQ